MEIDTRALLDAYTQLRPEVAPDWDDALRRAGLRRVELVKAPSPSGTLRNEPGSGQRSLRAPAATPRRRLRAGQVTLVAAGAAAVALAIAMFASSPSLSDAAVLTQALSSIGREPVVHVVFRDDTHEVFVDLKTGRTRPLYFIHEQWYERGRWLRDLSTINGQTVESITRRLRHARNEETATLAGILDGYRTALANGSAKVVGRGVLRGRSVTWIAFSGVQRFPHGDLHWEQHVALANPTLRPLYVRQTRGGRDVAGTGQWITRIETLPRRSLTFAQSPPVGAQVIGAFGVRQFALPADAKQMTRALGAPILWLGHTFSGLPLRFAQQQRLFSGRAASRRHFTGIELCYSARPPRIVGNGLLDCTGEHTLVIQEAREPLAWYRWPSPRFADLRPGTMLIGWGGTNGFAFTKGLHVHLGAAGPAELTRAAMALSPISTK
jgi:hypothetical protein